MISRLLSPELVKGQQSHLMDQVPRHHYYVLNIPIPKILLEAETQVKIPVAAKVLK
jgi:hypothetical protein